MQHDEYRRLAEEMIEAFNAGDWQAFRAHLAPDIVYEEAGTGRRVEGPDAYVQLCEAWRRAIPDLKGTLTGVIVDGNQMAERINWTGTHTGPLEAPGMTIPPTGRCFQLDSMQWVTLAEGKVKREFHQLDVMGLMQQLGILGSPEAQPA